MKKIDVEVPEMTTRAVKKEDEILKVNQLLRRRIIKGNERLQINGLNQSQMAHILVG